MTFFLAHAIRERPAEFHQVIFHYLPFPYMFQRTSDTLKVKNVVKTPAMRPVFFDGVNVVVLGESYKSRDDIYDRIRARTVFLVKVGFLKPFPTQKGRSKARNNQTGAKNSQFLRKIFERICARAEQLSLKRQVFPHLHR